FGVGVHHGWEPVGLPVTVTKSEGNRLFEINDLPAIRLYDEYFGEYTQKLRTEPLARLGVYYPLGLAVPESDEYLLRAPLSVAQDGSILFTAEVPAGAQVRLMIGSVESALKAARLAAQEAMAQMQGRAPKIALVFNAIARRRLFGIKANDEILEIRKIIGADVPLAGFYAYGEVAPMQRRPGKESCFHNETIVILTMG
ncbi:FIST C-terminal domain-containing protein, partial [candidate division FCPU426 bacterium]|nr:FIST C-terminal domain-containing protein [candidate division FCPU426 bacterium]